MINFFKKTEPIKTPEEVLDYVKKLEKKIDGLSSQIKELKEKNRLSIKKLFVKRYNPFSNVGGDQSFTVVLLDENNDGLIISSLFSQEGNRVYAKPVKNGVSEHTLSNEEKEVLEKAISSK